MILSERRNKKEWKDNEIRKLMKLAGNVSIEDIAKELKKSLKAVKSQCHRRGISYRINKGNNND
tara:strand:+ start:199 stop:390 length:192 start_codon:yes stop_codon:yes gene_type:complete